MTPAPGVPECYREIQAHLTIQQSEVFVLHGDVHWPPVTAGETLTDYLKRMALSPHRKAVTEFGIDDPEASALAVASRQLFVEINPTTGLIADKANRTN